MHMCFHDVGADIIRPCGEGLERLHGIGEFAESIRFVILSGGQSPESKDLRLLRMTGRGICRIR